MDLAGYVALGLMFSVIVGTVFFVRADEKTILKIVEFLDF